MSMLKCFPQGLAMPAQAHPTWCRSRAAARAGRWACKVTATANFEDTVTGMPAQEQAEAEVVRSLGLSGWVEEQLLPLLTPVDDAWQPSDLLPCFSLSAAGLSAEQQPSMMMTTEELQAQASGVPDDVLVCLVGNMVTEEALPTYMCMGNRVAGYRDDTGCSDLPWARWIRGWTAEENRHGDLLNRYLYLSGRVDMRQVERTVHHLLRNGMQMLRPSSPYHNAIYGSFQERATFISHAHTAKQAARHGDRCLAKICGVVAADEKRHETAYTKVAAKVFELDPDGMVQALAAVLRDKITMPGQLMTDGRDADLFEHFSAVAQRTGVYTARDYGDMVEHFVRRWKVADLGGGQLSGEGRRAQEYVCGLPRKIRRVEELAHDRVIKAAKEPEFARFSWVFDRPVCIRSLI
ncbi:acyl-[acyl-carrier-protein] desaturase 4, chloroplastic [Aegilops tauschii subsp. strangulata]|uniref:Acyl-(Acyl-carrier-protein) desaturase, chloroplastic n=4 Tax=Triticinae TaxID=1648030 RepID=A0A453KZ86_AEGTS|nr:acyl-[acyl-carrier-protein] desaturase 4, chloroplastic [Aegilops tauschii subsp. strangulata]XP_044397687.1 acyl-[acyl-carrier-protein] desaturase 4, chloroplastic-like [Triticum aestivum]